VEGGLLIEWFLGRMETITIRMLRTFAQLALWRRLVAGLMPRFSWKNWRTAATKLCLNMRVDNANPKD